ncbi:Calreticulin-domain-containing protein [Gonapodya prolifera JEL478]|uniref:Calreticulin-domain-containing protein n=1 Tax=Gonapodya prolifera (strain JEL478) TaxID=1344416 RepID=A0A139A618_GONPJ|nr:Calreticulin-domain-containing protein [Gonapodya prolifera JEL478]|eukprot:KXS11895.1 Calreticulin-domain-containing protein [Gonapodya prolifera JEL478]
MPRRRLVLSILVAALLCVASARADDHGHDHDGDSHAEPSPVAGKPAPLLEFKPTSIRAPFLEQFTDDWNTRWTVSQAKKIIDGVEDEDLLRYRGDWAVEEPTVLQAVKGDKGLVVKTPAAHHAIAAKFAKPVDAKGKSLVVQYEVKLQNGLECGGAYLKLLKESKTYDFTKFEDRTPYVIMFGPDKCGSTNKVHFIFRHKNPKTGEYEEKHANTPPTIKSGKTSTLYTLIVNPDNTFEILVNNVSEKKGSLLEDFTPSVNPPKEIDDPEDKKPSDWVDEAEIVDPKATKPEDWDEDAPEFITDLTVEKPEDWLDDEPLTIPDPQEEKPEDWDEEEDGEWVAPSIPNPACENGNCGEWKRPSIKNPEYKGKWSAPKIPNPAYKGPWAPRKIPNPNFFEDKSPADFEPIGAIGFEIWTMQENILFDNIYIGHSISDAKKLAEESWVSKYEAEKAQEEAENPAPSADSDKKEAPASFIDQAKAFFGEFAKDPVKAVESNPSIAIAVVVVLGSVVVLTAVSSSLGEAKPPAPKEVKGTEKPSGEKTEKEKEEKKEEGGAKKRKPKVDS